MTKPTTPGPTSTPGPRARASRSRTIWINVGLVIAFVAAVILALVLLRPAGAPDGGAGATAAPADLVRDDSHILGEPGTGGVTLVEFFDFECGACAAFFPIVEELREQHAGEVTFVARYFPLESHKNSRNAALAAEAAAQQGQYEAMYTRLFETQADWAGQPESEAPRFRQYAAALGLDLDAYDRAIADPATLDRVLRDFDDGVAIGVQSTPTFFLNGEKLQLKSYDDLENAIEKAVNE